ncbi:hypothetical protein PRIPAC_85102 [Pristionchus pacificus]|uniref:Uncharacterized protein n=1 Tax=Pristionchus pacificus TaxID=54126 RepID=A0A2A6BN79_PRIPA|nr:hypothetical protein PRIPAC_85102 [Pristionchus pacificus]|eukprot:PDM67364.1 hypothetical protein PRIPAC_48781 [Pristionchus pacificus]
MVILHLNFSLTTATKMPVVIEANRGHAEAKEDVDARTTRARKRAAPDTATSADKCRARRSPSRHPSLPPTTRVKRACKPAGFFARLNSGDLVGAKKLLDDVFNAGRVTVANGAASVAAARAAPSGVATRAAAAVVTDVLDGDSEDVADAPSANTRSAQARVASELGGATATTLLVHNASTARCAPSAASDNEEDENDAPATITRTAQPRSANGQFAAMFGTLPQSACRSLVLHLLQPLQPLLQPRVDGIDDNVVNANIRTVRAAAVKAKEALVRNSTAAKDARSTADVNAADADAFFAAHFRAILDKEKHIVNTRLKYGRLLDSILRRGEPNTQLDEHQVRAIMLVEHYGNFCLMHNEHLEEMNALAKGCQCRSKEELEKFPEFCWKGIKSKADYVRKAEGMKEEYLMRLEETLRKKYDDFEKVFSNRDGTKSTKSYKQQLRDAQEMYYEYGYYFKYAPTFLSNWIEGEGEKLFHPGKLCDALRVRMDAQKILKFKKGNLDDLRCTRGNNACADPTPFLEPDWTGGCYEDGELRYMTRLGFTIPLLGVRGEDTPLTWTEWYHPLTTAACSAQSGCTCTAKSCEQRRVTEGIKRVLGRKLEGLASMANQADFLDTILEMTIVATAAKRNSSDYTDLSPTRPVKTSGASAPGARCQWWMRRMSVNGEGSNALGQILTAVQDLITYYY